jgi:hypothetical protein
MSYDESGRPIAQISGFGVSFAYPTTYGLNNCSTHDAGLPPYCNVTTSTGAFEPHSNPSWCSSSWCYIDTSACNMQSSVSFYFSVDINYSYVACHSTNQFNAFYLSIQPSPPQPPSQPPSPPKVAARSGSQSVSVL